MIPRIGRTAALLAVIVLLAGCAAGKVFREAEQAAKRERWDQAVLGYAKAVSMEPGNTRYSVALTRAKLRAANLHFERGKRYVDAGQLELGIEELQQTVVLDPSNQYAMNELAKALERQRVERGAPSQIQEAKRRARERAEAMGPPKLDPTSNIPIVMNFPDSTVGEVYEAVSKASGINFLFDEKVDLDKEININVANVSFQKAMDILMLQNKHFYKVIDSHTILLADDTRPNRQEYEDQVIRTFYLSSADTKQVQTLLRTLLDIRKIAENPTLNSITLKNTPEVIKVAELIIGANDKSKAELVIDVELVEINRTSLEELGIDLSSKLLSLSFQGGGAVVPLNNLQILEEQANWTVGPIPDVLINFAKSDSDAKVIAKPQLRITEGEKASFVIGDRVPIPATTFNTSQTIGGNIVPVTSFTYQNVGIQVDIEPRVHHNKEITMKVAVEISALSGSVEGTGGVSQPIIGTRNIQTVIRLNDGETNLLAGLIREDERQSLSGIPGLSDIPGLRRLFGTTTTEMQKTDIVLTMTPHIIRIPDITEEDLVPLWVGTEEKVQLRGPLFNAWGESPFDNGDDGAAVVDVSAGTGAGADASPGAATGAEDADAPRRGRRGGRGDAADDAGGRDAGPPEPPEAPDDAGDLDVAADAEPEQQPARPEPPTVAQIRLRGPQTVVAGDPLEVVVAVDDAANLGQVSFQLLFDPEVLEFVPPAFPGEFLEQPGGSGSVTAVEAAQGGQIVVNALRLGEGASGAGTLVSLNFVAVSPGAAGLRFSNATVRDPDQANLPSSFRTLGITVAE